MNNPSTATPAYIEQHVLAAAEALVRAFAQNDTQAYFAAFSEDATFVFHTHPCVLNNRAAYRDLWDGWQQDGLRVLSCESRHPVVSLQGDVAIFVHDVTTRLWVGDQELQSRERETIVFRQNVENGPWLACHEHLSPLPAN